MDANGPTTTRSRGGSRENRGGHSRGSAGRGRGGSFAGDRGKKRDLGRSQYNKQKGNNRNRTAESRETKRQKIADGERELPVYATKFTEEELKDEERRPKKKVAVLIGYSGTGYKGMQLTHDQKTIEGDLFKAFVAAGAISKANADDPKKSSFVRCARTDKGVHAAGNVISLKLIVEDEDIVQKINDNLTSQIRVWGYERTSNSFSAYQLVDSRIYEYLIPSHAFLPPHPRSWLGRKCEEWAEKKGDTSAWEERQKEVKGYWDSFDKETIQPILAEYNDEIRTILEKAIWLAAEEQEEVIGEQNGEIVDNPNEAGTMNQEHATTASEPHSQTANDKRARHALVNEAVKKLRQAYVAAKRTYRIDSTRLQRVRDVLEAYVGTRNYHNYTIAKTFKDPSAKRVIKSFVVHGDPLLINGTEWLSLKVHGQSFMMHQIRKMVGMAALVVRCGCDPRRIAESYRSDNISIPKAPSLGLLLERPIFDSYNRKAVNELGRDPIDFTKYEKVMDEFKQKRIYDEMHAYEEQENVFGNFFNHIDSFPAESFLYLTSGGIEATKIPDSDATDPAAKRRLKLGGVEVSQDGQQEDVDSDAEPDIKDGAGNEG